jgi:hypothetical protein
VLQFITEGSTAKRGRTPRVLKNVYHFSVLLHNRLIPRPIVSPSPCASPPPPPAPSPPPLPSPPLPASKALCAAAACCRQHMSSPAPLPSLASLSDTLPDAEGWSAEEVSAIKETKKLLLQAGVEPARISPMELSLCVMNCKLRPQKAMEKYKSWLAALQVFGIGSMEEVWGGQGAKARMQPECQWTQTLIDEFLSYARAGRDSQGRSIMWIRGGRKCAPENEREHVIAGQMCNPPPPPRSFPHFHGVLCLKCFHESCVERYFIAVHSAFKEMREGITFIIDTTDDSMMTRQGSSYSRPATTTLAPPPQLSPRHHNSRPATTTLAPPRFIFVKMTRQSNCVEISCKRQQIVTLPQETSRSCRKRTKRFRCGHKRCELRPPSPHPILQPQTPSVCGRWSTCASQPACIFIVTFFAVSQPARSFIAGAGLVKRTSVPPPSLFSLLPHCF